jgi:anion-transporting  ArsA/GET3 family ATPase
MSVETIFQSRLLFVSGKGGVGKTSFAASLAKASSKKGKKVLLVEIDNIHPSLTSIFGVAPEYEPKKVHENLSISNLTWEHALEDWLADTVKSRTVVQMILSNRVAMIFLDATPGAREIVILAKIISLLKEWDQVIVDLPASGHALGILRVPQTAKKLMKAGPVHEVANKIIHVFEKTTSRVVLVSLPEEMVVNETIEFSQKLEKEVPQLNKPIVLLNRMSIPSLHKDENALIDRLRSSVEDEKSAELIDSVVWERDLEEASQRAVHRLQEMQEDTLISFQRLGLLGGYKGGSSRVVEQMESALLRMVVQ